MTTIHVGVDASKGYADFCFLNEAGSPLRPPGCFDDTPAGHQAVRQAFADLAGRQAELRFKVGVESSGGLERNWLRLFQGLGPPCQVYQLNPLAVKRFLERDLHHNVTDPISARGIASYLREGLRAAEVPYEPFQPGLVAFYRHVTNQIERGVQLQNELQSLLPSVQPGLVSFCRHGLPQWVLQLLARYPTVTALSRAHAKTLAQIPYLTPARAQELIAAAKVSVAALRDPATGEVIAALAKEILRLDEQVDDAKQTLVKQCRADPTMTEAMTLLTSLPGIGAWTAVTLLLELGPIERFHSAAALVAYAGLDPRVHQSGDDLQHRGISRRGRPRVRALLYMSALTALRDAGLFREFYQRLKERGKCHDVAVTACMAKLLRIAYACLMSRTPFDPQRHAALKARHEQARQAAAAAPAPASPGAAAAGALDAPVSRREAKRRRAAAMPQAGVTPREGGPGAALVVHDTPASRTCQPAPSPTTIT